MAELRVEIAELSRIVLNRPEQRNAMTPSMGDEVVEAVRAINASPLPRIVLVEAEGRAFCAGGDFAMLNANAKKSGEENRLGMLAFYRRYLSILELQVPTIAVIHGAAVGAGLCFALACDLRLAATEAKLGANFVRVGLHPGMGCSALLPHLVGPAKAAELLLSGKLISGEEAERIGMVNCAVPREQLSGLVEQWSMEILQGAPIAVAQTAQTLREPALAALRGALEREAFSQAIGFATEDLREALAAFDEGRAPRFRGC